MSDFFRYDIQSTLRDDDIWKLASRALPMFRWRRGDSDAQGPYIKGQNDDSVMIELWLGENPIAMGISFRNAWKELSTREQLKQTQLDLILKHFVSFLGEVIARRENL